MFLFFAHFHYPTPGVESFWEHRQFVLARLVFSLCETEIVALIPELRATRRGEDSAPSPRTLRFIRGKSICRAAFLRGKYCLAPSLLPSAHTRQILRSSKREIIVCFPHARAIIYRRQRIVGATTNVPTIFSHCGNVASAIFKRGRFRCDFKYCNKQMSLRIATTDLALLQISDIFVVVIDDSQFVQDTKMDKMN